MPRPKVTSSCQYTLCWIQCENTSLLARSALHVCQALYKGLGEEGKEEEIKGELALHLAILFMARKVGIASMKQQDYLIYLRPRDTSG